MDVEIIAQLTELFSVARIVQIGLVLSLTWLILKVLHLGLHQLKQSFPKYRLQMGRVFPVIRIGFWVLAIVYIVFGIIKPPQAIVFAVLGSIGLAIGLGAQDGVRNLLAGVMMIFNPPFRVGDMVTFGGYYGEVIRLDLSVTILRTLDDNEVMVPNSVVMENAVSNANSGELSEMVVVNIDVPQSVEIHAVRLLAKEAAVASPYTYLKKPVTVIVEARYDYGHLLKLVIKAYVVDVRLERLLASDITERLVEAMQAENINPASYP